MCIIFSADKGNMIPLEAIQDGTRKNSDGWGVMTHTGQELLSFKDPNADAEAVYEITRKLTTPTVVHLRMTTHGHNTMDNTHPFEVIPGRLLMMHNGVVEVPVPHRSQKSDTRVLVDDYIKPLVGNKPGRIRNKGFKNFLQSLIGDSSNRLVFMDDTGELTYFNKRLGLEWKGIWASNTYGWTLHSEGKRSRITNYDSYKAWTRGWDDDRYDSYWRKDTTPQHIGQPVRTACDDGSFIWADKNLQASDDIEDVWCEGLDPNDECETENGYFVPGWVGSVLDMCFDEMTEQLPETLAAVIENLRDTYIGEVK